MMWFEDVQTGVKTDIGTYTFTAEKIIDFARKYDPQSFHLSVEAGEASVFGALIASGWHTVSVWMKLMVASRQMGDDRPGDPPRSGVSPGFEALRWVKPVRAGMTLRYSTQTLEKVDLKSRPHLGLVKSFNEARDEATGALMMSFIGKGFMPKRPKGE
jgi:acyl dehydratase